MQEKLRQQEEELRQLNSLIEQEQSLAVELPDLGQLQAQQKVACLEEEVRAMSLLHFILHSGSHAHKVMQMHLAAALDLS